MRINKQKFTKRNIAIITAIIVLAAVGVVAVLALTSGSQDGDSKVDDTRPENSVDYGDATEKQKEAGSKAKEDFISRHDSENQPSPTPTPSNVTVTITSAVQQDDMLQVRSMIETTTVNGTCKLTLSRSGSSPVAQSAGTQVMGTYSVCQGFNVPLDGLSKGQWLIKIEYSNGESGGVAEKKVDIT